MSVVLVVAKNRLTHNYKIIMIYLFIYNNHKCFLILNIHLLKGGKGFGRDKRNQEPFDVGGGG